MACRQIPLEIIETIIQCIPDSDKAVALPASHIVAKTLYACLFVSKATFASSLEQLHRQCLYIDSPRRLQALNRSYTGTLPVFGRAISPSQFRTSASTSLYLAPFSKDTIDEPSVVENISRLFAVLGEHITRLVIDMPLRSYYPDEPGSPNLRSALRNAFLRLTMIKEFVSVRDELYLSTTLPSDHNIQPEVWSTWANLRVLALYNFCLDEERAAVINEMPSLRELVLTRPDLPNVVNMLRSPDLVITMVNTWRDFHPQQRRSMDEKWNPARPFGEMATWHRTSRGIVKDGTAGRFGRWKLLDFITVDGQNPVRDQRSDSPYPANTQFRGNNWAAYDLQHTFNDIRFCQEWVKKSALNGCLLPDLAQSWPQSQFAVKSAPSFDAGVIEEHVQ